MKYPKLHKVFVSHSELKYAMYTNEHEQYETHEMMDGASLTSHTRLNHSMLFYCYARRFAAPNEKRTLCICVCIYIRMACNPTNISQQS